MRFISRISVCDGIKSGIKFWSTDNDKDRMKEDCVAGKDILSIEEGISAKIKARSLNIY